EGVGELLSLAVAGPLPIAPEDGAGDLGQVEILAHEGFEAPLALGRRVLAILHDVNGLAAEAGDEPAGVARGGGGRRRRCADEQREGAQGVERRPRRRDLFPCCHDTLPRFQRAGTTTKVRRRDRRTLADRAGFPPDALYMVRRP